MKTSLIALILFFQTSSWGFTLNNTAGAAFTEDEVKLYFADNCVNSGIDTSEWLYLISQTAQRFWNTAPTSRLTLSEAGTRSVSTAFYTDSLCTNSSSDCDINPDLIVSDNILISCNEEATINFPDDRILAKALPNNTNGKTINGAIVLINDTATNRFQSMSIDEKISVVAHEIGHALGLGHSRFREALMYAESLESRTKLGWDDIEGLSFLYPKEQPFGGFCSTIRPDHIDTDVHHNHDHSAHDHSDENKAPYVLMIMLGAVVFFTYRKLLPRL